MAGSFAVNISAKDSATGTLDSINKRMANVNREIARARKPFDQAAESYGKFLKLTGADRIASSLRNVSRAGFSAFQSAARIVEPLAAITGAASIAGMMRLALAWAQFGTQLGNTAVRAGLTSDQLQTLQNAGRLAGVSAQALTTGMTTLRDNMTNAVSGRAPQVVGMMQALGVSFRDASGHARATTTLLPELADKIAALRDPTLQAEAATALFGGAGEELLPFLRKGSAGIAEYNEKARKYGLVNADGVAKANRLREAQVGLQLAFEGLGNSVASRLAPVLSSLLDQMATWIATDAGDKVDQFASFLKSVDWAKIGSDISGIAHSVSGVVDALGGWMRVGEGLAAFFAITWLARMLAPIAAIAASLRGLPALAAGAAVKANVEMGKIKPGGNLLGKLGKLSTIAMVADAVLPIVDPDNKAGAWIHKNVPGAAFSDTEDTQGYLKALQDEKDRGDALPWYKRLYSPNNGLLNSFPTGGPNSNLANRGHAANSGVGVGQAGGPRGARPHASGEQWSADLAQLQSYGWSREQAAGMLGNTDQESGGNEKAVGDGGFAYGLQQWHQDRQDKFAGQFGHAMQSSTHAEQIQFMNWEMNNSEKAAGDQLRAQTTARGSAAAVRKYYERPADAYGNEDTWRGDKADSILTADNRRQSGAMPSAPARNLPDNAGTAASPGGGGIVPNGKVDIGLNIKGASPDMKVSAVQSGAGIEPLRVERSGVGSSPIMG